MSFRGQAFSMDGLQTQCKTLFICWKTEGRILSSPEDIFIETVGYFFNLYTVLEGNCSILDNIDWGPMNEDWSRIEAPFEKEEILKAIKDLRILKFHL